MLRAFPHLAPLPAGERETIGFADPQPLVPVPCLLRWQLTTGNSPYGVTVAVKQSSSTTEPG
jgi:hypothetical protein